MNVQLHAIESLRPIAPHARLWACESACLPHRFPATSCEACIRACPVQVLQLDDEGFRLADGCEACGRCAAACPTGALALQDFSLPPPGMADTIYIECHQVPESALLPGAQQVPCLGGLKCSQLLGQLNEVDNRLQLVDRGWCQACRAGGQPVHPASAQVATAQVLLSKTGLNPERIDIRHDPIDAPKQPTPGHEPVLNHPVSRRGFMRHLVGQAATMTQPAPATHPLDEPALIDGRARIVPVERLRIIAELQRLAGKKAALPARLFHHVDIDTERCGQHQLCTTTCPVTALRRLDDEHASAIAFHPLLCIGCGECRRNCPEQAITLKPAGEPQQDLQPILLSRHRQYSCFDCGHDFSSAEYSTDHEAEPLCSTCRKSRELGRALFGGLF